MPRCNVYPGAPCNAEGVCDSLWCNQFGGHGGVQYRLAKVRIELRDGGWICYAGNPKTASGGFGATPDDAYENWLALQSR